VKAIAAVMGRSEARLGQAGAEGSREAPRLDALANAIFQRACEWGGHVAGMVSEEAPCVVPIPERHRRGKYLLAFDPLDGSSNIDVNASVGTIFSILKRPGGAGDARAEDFFQPGASQVAAGYALYGPCTVLVVALGRGVQGFTLDRELGDFVLTHPDMRIPEGAREIAIDASNERFWQPPVKRYVDECLAGRSGPRGADYGLRWSTSLVAEVHRVLLRGGVALHPREGKLPGRLRFLFEASPVAFLVEQAGGSASTGLERLLDVTPGELHQRVPLFLGDRSEVERIVRYHSEHARGEDQPFRSPLFGTRSLFSRP
jgi:fructose-1,6-bisphosphatase